MEVLKTLVLGAAPNNLSSPVNQKIAFPLPSKQKTRLSAQGVAILGILFLITGCSGSSTSEVSSTSSSSSGTKYSVADYAGDYDVDVYVAGKVRPECKGKDSLTVTSSGSAKYKEACQNPVTVWTGTVADNGRLDLTRNGPEILSQRLKVIGTITFDGKKFVVLDGRFRSQLANGSADPKIWDPGDLRWTAVKSSG